MEGRLSMLINCHTHTARSHDSAADPFAVCASALKKNLAGIIFTDHCDCEFAHATDIFSQFDGCAQDFAKVKSAYTDKLQLFFGIELGDPLFDPAFARKIIAAHPFDAILLSVHAVRMPGYSTPFSRIDFGFADDDFLYTYLKQYFTDVLASVKTFDFDILCHLTVPLRYIMLKYHKKIDLSPFSECIDRILTETLTRDKTLEVNTSALALAEGFLMPDETIIDRYLRLGGTAFSIGSDAHTPENIASGLAQTAALLRSKGIKKLCCYNNRQRFFYSID